MLLLSHVFSQDLVSLECFFTEQALQAENITKSDKTIKSVYRYNLYSTGTEYACSTLITRTLLSNR